MGYFRDSVEEVQACIDALVSAQIYQDADLRRAAALEAITKVEQLRIGRRLAPQIRKLVEADDLPRAILLLRTYQQNRGIRLGLLPALVLPVVALGYFLIFPRMGGHHDAALKVASDCSTAAELLGDGIAMPVLGLPTGSTMSNSGMRFADWSIPVKGRSGRGTLSYLAYEHAGPWSVYHASLEVGDEHYLVVPCWGKVPAADAAGRLARGYDGQGVVARVQGGAPVKTGERCAVAVAVEPDYPDSVPFNCKIQVTCANQVLYGGAEQGGYAFCHARDGAPVSAFDDGGSDATGDPILELDLDKRELRLADDASHGAYELTITEL